MSEPTRFGAATSQNSCWGVNAKPAEARKVAVTLHSSQTENPRCSAKIDHARLRRATRLPVDSQNAVSSGSQWSIQRPVRRRGGAVASASGAVAGGRGVSISIVMDCLARFLRGPLVGPWSSPTLGTACFASCASRVRSG